MRLHLRIGAPLASACHWIDDITASWCVVCRLNVSYTYDVDANYFGTIDWPAAAHTIEVKVLRNSDWTFS